VAENICRFDIEATSDAILKAAQIAGVHDIILRLPEGYSTRIGQGGMSLSAGQRQRIGLARAVFGDPFLVVLDEPNANLDSEGENALTRAILILRQSKCIVIVISHRPSALAALNMAMVLFDGKSIAFGPSQEIFARVRSAMPQSAAAAQVGAAPQAGVAPHVAAPPRAAAIQQGAGAPQVAAPPRAAAVQQGAGAPQVAVPPRAAAVQQGAGAPQVAAAPRAAAVPQEAAAPQVVAPPRAAAVPSAATAPRAPAAPQVATAPRAATGRQVAPAPIPRAARRAPIAEGAKS
jgi:ABC-type glutathione transport system ATPase component